MNTENFSKTVVFCIEGKEYVQEFMRAWTEIVAYCFTNNIRPVLSIQETNYFNSKMRLVQSSGHMNVPFNDNIKYDYIIFMNSSFLVNSNIVKELLAHELDIVSCLTLNKNSLQQSNYIEKFDLNDSTVESYSYENMERPNQILKEYKEYVNSKNDISGNDVKDDEPSTLLKVEHLDFTVLCIKKGVLEKLPLPWFNFEQKTNDITGEVYFCNKCKTAGIDIYVDLKLQASSVKSVIL